MTPILRFIRDCRLLILQARRDELTEATADAAETGLGLGLERLSADDLRTGRTYHRVAMLEVVAARARMARAKSE